MKFVRVSPDIGYLEAQLWVPKSKVNVDSLKSVLTFSLEGRQGSVRYLKLWTETDHHIIIPRAMWRPEDRDFEIVDCRPESYAQVDIESHLVLDAKNPALTTQRDAVRAVLPSDGILQLACLAGDTVIQLNRGGKGFSTTIKSAYEHLHDPINVKGRMWDPKIPTRIRSKKEERIGLHTALDVIYKGKQQTLCITLENGGQLRLTKDHEVLTKLGFVPAELLRPGAQVITDGKRETSVRKKRVAYARIGGFNYHPFSRYQSRSWCIEEHRAIAEAHLNNLTLQEYRNLCKIGEIEGIKFVDPTQFHVHHKDGNIHNNSPNNLEVVPKSAHMQKHQPGYPAFGHGVPTPVTITSVRPGQLEDVYDVICADPYHNFVANGVVVHNCGKGKTCIALHVASLLKVPTLIVVNNTTLLKQWVDEIRRHLTVPEGMGLIQGKVNDWQKPIVLSTYQTLAERADDLPQEVRRWFGFSIYDEGHHCSAPWFCRTVDLTYGKRLLLTATPDRKDGSHVVYKYHVGEVLYKDLKQDLTPHFTFLWSGLSLPTDDRTLKLVCDKNSELHLGKLAAYFGCWRERLDFIIKHVRTHVASKRKILVLSTSVAELVNLYLLYNGRPPTYSSFESLENKPSLPSKLARDSWERNIRKLEAELNSHRTDDIRKARIRDVMLPILHSKIQAAKEASSTEKQIKKDQASFIREALTGTSNAGLMIAKVPVTERMRMLKECDVVFTIYQYGLEGLDNAELDTIIAAEPMTSKNAIQQFVGRVLRLSNNVRKSPIVQFIEDDIGPIIGMCKSIRKQLRLWPVDEGGPYKYTLVGHPGLQPTRRF